MFNVFGVPIVSLFFQIAGLLVGSGLIASLMRVSYQMGRWSQRVEQLEASVADLTKTFKEFQAQP
jgi:hypothetical protein